MQSSYSELETEFTAHLSAQRGYPEQSLVRNLGVSVGRGRRYEIDLVVVDPERGDALAVVELKGGPVRDRLPLAFDHVRQARRALGKPGIPGFVVHIDGAGRRVFSVASGADSEDRELSDFPSFSSLLLQARASDQIAQQIEKKDAAEGRRRTIDRFRVACWVLAVFALALFAADVNGWLSLNSQQMGLLGVFAILLLIPDIAKLNFLGIEFQRHAPSHVEDNERKP